MRNKRQSPHWTFALCGAALIALTGCTSTSAPAPIAHYTSTPTPTAAKALVIPPTQKGELTRLTAGGATDFIGTSLALPPSKDGYAVEFACLSSSPSDRSGWEIDDTSSGIAEIEASSAKCDGTPYQDADASMTAGYKRVNFHFTGDFAGATAYAILIPSPFGPAPTN